MKSYSYLKVINAINIYWQLRYVLKPLEYLCKRLYYGNEKNKAADEKKNSSYHKINILCSFSFWLFIFSFTFSSLCSTLSGRDWQLRYIHAISPSARSYSLLEPSSTGQINLPCQWEGALRGPISRWLGQGWEGWGVTAMGPSQAWLVSISSQPQGQLGAEPQ